MANKLYNESDIQAIANAIRAKGGASSTMTVSQMATNIANIPSGGGGSDGIYLVETIAERNAIQNPQSGDICVVYSQALAPLPNPPVAGVATFPDSVTLTTEVEEEEYYAISCNNYDDYCMFDINLESTACYISLENDEDMYGVEYTSSDGIHYTKSGGISTFNLPSGSWNVNMFDSICANFMLVNTANFPGIYEYKNNTWYYLDIGIYADENKMFQGAKGYTSQGVIEGALDSQQWNPLMYKIGTELPEDVEMENETFFLVDENIDENLLNSSMKNTCGIVVTENEVRDINKATPIPNVTLSMLSYGAGMVYTRVGTTYYVLQKPNQGGGEFFSLDLKTGTKTTISSSISTYYLSISLNEDDNDTIYYSVDNSVYSYSITNGTISSLFTASGNIYGLIYNDGKIYYNISDTYMKCYDITNQTTTDVTGVGKYKEALKTRCKFRIGQDLYYCTGYYSNTDTYVVNLATSTGYKVSALGDIAYLFDNTIYVLNGGVLYALSTDFTYYTTAPTPYSSAYSCDCDVHVAGLWTTNVWNTRNSTLYIAPDTNGDVYVGGFNSKIYKITNISDLGISFEGRTSAYILVKKSYTKGTHQVDYTNKNSLYLYQNLILDIDDVDVVALSGKNGEPTASWLKKVYKGKLDNNSWTLFKDYDPE